ncbi:MAG: exonuclease, polymerase epsilon subunit family [Anaerocolumna sp.]|jgi:DNA polymerase-3 subunit alpha (Gram-positive type)|nr:exonuclease, polymerase epsilon subunit family [Anaerocolumna sp.]
MDNKKDKKNLTKTTTFVCFDIETTGLNPQNEKIIEIGALKVIDGKIVGNFSELINPQVPLSKMITNLTGISDDMVKDADTEENVIKRFLDFAGDYIVMGHNIKFDYSFIKTAAKRYKINFERLGIDTLDISRKMLRDLESRSLESLCKYYQITNNHAHRAYDDAKATTLLYVNLCNQFYLDNPDVFTPKPLIYKAKKIQAITNKQKNYLIDLLKYHNIEDVQPIDTLTQSEASKWIDRIILEYGRIN